MLTACIAEIGILIANLDSVAPIITMWVFLFIPSSIRYFEVAWGTGSRWLSECIVGLFWGSNLPSCWKCVLQNSLTMHFDNHFDPVSCAQHGCESALWDCFGGRICRHVENASPKTVPQCTFQTSLPGLLRTTWLWKCIVGLFWGTNLPPCWKCFPQNRPTMHFNNLEPGLPGNLKSASVPTTNGMQKTPSITQDLNLTNRQWTSHLSWEFLRVEISR